MSAKIVYDGDGNPFYVEADAGKKGEKRLRARFSLKKFHSVENAIREAGLWEQRMQSMKRLDTSELFLKSRRDQEKCLEALELLEPYSDQIDVAGAAKFWLITRQSTALKEPWPYKEAANNWLADKAEAKQSKKYLKEMEIFLTLTSRYFGKKLCDSITTDDLKSFIRDRDKLLIAQQKSRQLKPVGLSAVTRNNYKRLFSVLFNYAVAQRHASHNPARALLTAKVVHEPAELLTPAQTRDYLSACELHFLPYAAAGFFAGIRPEGEMQRMKSADFELDRLIIDVRAAASKTNQRRPIEIMPNLYIWLKPIVHLFNKPLTESEVRGARERASAASGVELPRDPFRKCFASYHYSRFQDLKKTMYFVGHTNHKTFFDHYFDSADQTDAIRYFSILPSSCKFKHAQVRDLYAGIDETLPEAKVIQLHA
jgi:integrase